MAIGEKKQLLRGMYAAPPADNTGGEVPPQGEMAAAVKTGRRMEAGLDRAVSVAAFMGLMFLVAVGVGPMVWTLYREHQAGLALAPLDRSSEYVLDFFRMEGLAMLLLLLGAGVFVVTREQLPRGWRWVPVVLLILLLPAGVGVTVALSGTYASGRLETLRGWNLEQLQKDAAEICEMFPPDDNNPRTINSGDAEYDALPEYTRLTLKPAQVLVYPRGIALRVESASRFSWPETIVVPAAGLSRSEEAALAAQKNYQQLREGESVFRVKDEWAYPVLEDPRQSPASGPYNW